MSIPLLDSIDFHIAYYQLKKAREDGQIEGNLWKVGRLHDDPFDHHGLRGNDRILGHEIASNRKFHYLRRSSISVCL